MISEKQPFLSLRVLWLVVAGVTAVVLLSSVSSSSPIRPQNWTGSAQLKDLVDVHNAAAAACPVCPSASTPSSDSASCPPAPACSPAKAARPFGTAAASPSWLPATSTGPTCGVDPALTKEYGRHSIKLSRAHEGSGFRVQRVLAKAKRGEKIKVALLGGSVSEGHGFLKRPNVYGAIPHDQTWHQLVVQELTRQFGADAIEFLNGAKAATDSSYFEWCYPAHIGTEPDLVFIELAVNDDFSTAAFDSTEGLLRSLLSLPSQPAVIFADAFALVTGRGKPMSINGGDAHSHLAVRYDIPHISIRAAALTAMMDNPDLAGPWFNHDARHIAAPFHRFLGDMVKAYLQSELCELEQGGWEAAQLEWGSDERHGPWPGMKTLGEMPKNRITESWNSVAEHAVAPPTCRLAGPEGSEAELKPSKASADWELYSWRYSKYYIQTTKPNAAPITFQVELGPGSRGEVALGYLRSREYGLGKARCSVAGQSKIVDGYWTSSTNVAQTMVIATKVKPGTYEVVCQTLPEKEQKEGIAFRIMSLMSV